MTGTMTWAAMDVHARSTYAASLDVVSGELSRRRFDTGAVEPVVGWLAGLPGPVRCCYEAGPTGFGLYRAAVAAGIDCQVIAPSKTPRASGDRNKSDRRDTDLLLRALMAGGLTAVVVPSATCEAARDLARAREQVRVDLMRCRQRLSKLLLRHGRVWDRSAWTKVHREWLSAQTFEQVNMRAGVHRQPRRVRRAECPQGRARRATLTRRDRPGVLAAGAPACARSVGSTPSRRWSSRSRSATSPGSRARCSSDRGWGWCPPASSPASPITMGRSPRPARSTPGGSWSRRPGITPAHRGSGARSTSARRGCPTTSCRSHDAPRARLYRLHKRMRERNKPGNVIVVACARELACFLWAAATAP